MNERVLLSSPHLGGGEMNYIQQAFATNWVAPLGANVTAFEQALAGYTGAPHVTALVAGTAGLHLAVRLAGVHSGDLVFCQDLTFVASANPILYEGGRPVFLDSERETWNLDPAALQRAIQIYGVPKALVVTDLYGTPARLTELAALCGEYGIILIEDAAEALGSSCDGKSCGVFGRFGVLSFNGNKIITTSGGGALLCQNQADTDHALKLATQAKEPVAWYEHKEIGYNYRLSNICAGIGCGQMEVLEARIARKREIFMRYQQAFTHSPVTMLSDRPGTQANCWLTNILLDEGCAVTPGDCIAALDGANMEARRVWKPMHMQPLFADAPYVRAGETSVSEDLFQRGVCLPSDTKMTDCQVDCAAQVLKKLWGEV